LFAFDAGETIPNGVSCDADRPVTLAVGTKLGPYEIVAPIGAGGMGEVYRARDPRLGRDVAIKVLPAAVRADAERLRRFEQEARAAAALNHPNIVTIFSVEHAGDVPFVTMEFVEGTPLTRLIPRAGLPVDRILKIAIALGDAVSAAHSRGIVHRDLKPSNVMVTADDRVKVLDFGLAKLLHAQSVDVGATAAATDPLTDPGMIVGTLPYMSPEQVEGKPVDHRSDIFSLGVILYELTTGQRPFKGETSASLVSSILKDSPPLASDISSAVPRDLGRIIRHSLAKDPAQRYQTALDLRNELAELQQDLSSGSLPAPIGTPRAPSDTWRWGAIGAATAVAVIVAVGYVLLRPQTASNRPAISRNVTFDQLTTQSGVKRYPSLSPDGKWVVYEGNQSGNLDIYLQSVGGQNAINLTRDSLDDDTEPAFSPDGELIAFRSSRQDGGIIVMGRTGESVRRLTNLGYSPAWAPDGTTIVYATDDATVLGRMTRRELWTVTVATGEKRRIAEADAVQPNWSPNGLRIAYWKAFGERQGQRHIWTIPAAGGVAVPVTSDTAVNWNPVWSPDGHSLLFSSDRGGPMNLWRVPIDERTGATLGPPEALSAPSSFAGLMSVSADGHSVAYTSLTTSQTIQRVAFDPASGSIRGEPVTVVSGSRPFEAPAPSPDGGWLAFNNLGPQMNIFVSRGDGTGIRQLTNDRARNRFPTWSPDGRQIAFLSKP
jgi:eukaryotic-like serine/threonine-protein kinase